MQLLDCKLQLGTKSYNWEIRRTEEFKVRIEKNRNRPYSRADP